MPKETSSPFTPGIPVPVEFFVGRMAEIEHLRIKVANARSGRIEVGFLVGERGIGKSSLAAFVKVLLERNDQALGVHTFLGGVRSLEEMVRCIFDRLLKESVGTSWFTKVKELFGKHVRKVGLFGVNFEFVAPLEDLQQLLRNFAAAMRDIVERVKDEKKVLFIVLDDFNGLASLPDFANWLKSLVDEIATSQRPLPLYLLLVGLEERRQELIRLQPSLARVFDVVEIRGWSEEETSTFYQTAFSKVGMEVEPAANGLLTSYAGSLPVFAQEIGDAAFNLDQDNRIDNSDASQAIATAAAIIGRKYLEPQIVQVLRSIRYRSILRKLAKQLFAVEFQRGEVLEQLATDEKRVFDNFLRRMTRLGVISKNPERGPGAYRFTKLLHHAYFWLEATPDRLHEYRKPQPR